MKKSVTSITLQLKITLRETSPIVWREVWIPAGFNFYQLHKALQAAFGWENTHLFQFCERALIYDDGIGIPDDESPVEDARQVILNTIFKKRGDRFLYIYDFGDYWEHEIVLQKLSKEDSGFAICITGEGECPPEDMGGTTGYAHMLRLLASDDSEDHEGYHEWLGLKKGETWNPEFYRQREVDKRMNLLAPDEFTFG